MMLGLERAHTRTCPRAHVLVPGCFVFDLSAPERSGPAACRRAQGIDQAGPRRFANTNDRGT
ncbi:hypothetical protein BGC31_14375 [Komagataeibacter xylinus]|nr:hypothetical protein BGC31_14375 [Komagataeibacter xylinus]RFP06411.1 hypothetical protein BFX83_12295 [Komagataeibacter xylinus]